MSLNESVQVPRRRRGAALEEALLAAAWDELVEKGYDAFTIESVAERARTSRAVLYRRWATKPELARAAIARTGLRDRVPVPDTGSLRGDLIALMRTSNEVRVPFAILLTTRLGAFYADTGTTFADLRDEFVDSSRASTLDTLYDRAVARGEVDPAKLTLRVRSVAFDLYRHEVLMTNRPVPDEVLESIVDDIVLPLVRSD